MTRTVPPASGAARLVAAQIAIAVLLAFGSSAFAQRAQRTGSDTARAGAPSSPDAAGNSSANPAPATPPSGADDGLRPSDILIDRPDDVGPSAEPGVAATQLGEAFESKGQGISVRPPHGSTAIRRPGGTDIVEFVNKETGWVLKVSKIKLTENASLTQHPDAQGRMTPGLLEHTARRLREEIPDGEFLRTEGFPLAAGDAGMIVLRHTQNLKPVLSQQAIIRKNDRLYYLLALTTPGAPKGSKDGNAQERRAVDVFGEVLDSVKLLDLQAIRADQDLRLFSTRTLMLRWKSDPALIREALIPEHWARVLKNGKDVGYTYVAETDTEQGRALMKGNLEGFEVRVRSRTRSPGSDTQIDTGSIQFASLDLRNEDWSTMAVATSLKRRAADKDYRAPHVTEFGVSERRAVAGRGDDYTLKVIYETSDEPVEPISRPLPPFYLPQAMAHLLPRLVPLNEPKNFLFMVYVPESREVVMRYIDVKASQRVEFNKELLRATPVEDRLGLEGSVTTHYMSPEGRWIGSENKQTGVMTLPTNEATLLAQWQDADLSKPEAPAARDGVAAEADPADRGTPRARRSPAAAGGASDSGGTPTRATPRLGERRRPPAARDDKR